MNHYCIQYKVKNDENKWKFFHCWIDAETDKTARMIFKMENPTVRRFKILFSF